MCKLNLDKLKSVHDREDNNNDILPFDATEKNCQGNKRKASSSLNRNVLDESTIIIEASHTSAEDLTVSVRIITFN